MYISQKRIDHVRTLQQFRELINNCEMSKPIIGCSCTPADKKMVPMVCSFSPYGKINSYREIISRLLLYTRNVIGGGIAVTMAMVTS